MTTIIAVLMIVLFALSVVVELEKDEFKTINEVN